MPNLKSEALNPKLETTTNSQNPNEPKEKVLNSENSKFVQDFEFGTLHSKYSGLRIASLVFFDNRCDITDSAVFSLKALFRSPPAQIRPLNLNPVL
jgi:hypothetical protein